MKRQISCIVAATMTSVLIIAGANFAINAEKIFTYDREGASHAVIRDDDYIVSDYAKDNYSRDNFWKTNNYNPVEYVEAAAGVMTFDGTLDAQAAILVDVDTKTIIYGKNADEKLYPASTAKLATAITAIGILDFDEKVTVGNEINLIGIGSSTAGLKKGDVLTVRELMEGMLISSGNDAAYVLARAAGQGILEDNIAYDGEKLTIEQCIKRFIYEMNKNARDIGLDNTCFTSPDGYDDNNQYTTAGDLSKIALVAYGNEEIRKICNMEGSYSKNGNHRWTTTNELIKQGSQYYYEYAMGMKTGSTDNAGKCLVAVAKKDGQTCISVVLNSTEDGRYKDSIKLLKFGLGE